MKTFGNYFPSILKTINKHSHNFPYTSIYIIFAIFKAYIFLTFMSPPPHQKNQTDGRLLI